MQVNKASLKNRTTGGSNTSPNTSIDKQSPEFDLPRQPTPSVYSDELKDSIRMKNGCNINMDSFGTLKEVTRAIKDEGLEKCGLLFGIDYTMSNKIQGSHTFGGKSLHHISETGSNPYQEVICILGETLETFNEGSMNVYGFGDSKVKDKGIFTLKEDCDGFYDVLEAYNTETPKLIMAGPTNFAPLIEEAIEVVKKKRQYHILIIAADGQVSVREQETIDAIVKASRYPLAIILIGLGDGPWDIMIEFDKKLPERTFDNFKFVDFHSIMVNEKDRNRYAALARTALTLIPGHYKSVKEARLIEKMLQE